MCNGTVLCVVVLCVVLRVVVPVFKTASVATSLCIYFCMTKPFIKDLFMLRFKVVFDLGSCCVKFLMALRTRVKM